VEEIAYVGCCDIEEMKTHLVFGVLTLTLLVIVLTSRRQEVFTFEQVVAMAETMAREGYLSAAPALPKELRNLNYDQLRDIRWRDERTLWLKEGLPFQARFFHPGGEHHDRTVEIFVLPENAETPLRYSPEFFDFGKNVFPGKLPYGFGYAGFRLLYPMNQPGVLDEVAVFLGASYFRAVPKGLSYGLSARGLAIDTVVEKRKEEFPVFTKFWLVRPDSFARQMTVYALLEGRNVTGAYQFVIQPGVETRMHVTATLFFRNKTEHVGYAPLTSMFWYGENSSNTFGDFRPEVHDSDGFLMQRSNGEWVWHPLAWSQQTQLNVFSDTKPLGFGLMQRDRDFSHYQDLEAVYHQRPSAWVQPIQGFEKGSVRLVQLATKDEYKDNVIAFWTPETPPPLLEPVRIEYVLRWFGEATDLPPIGRCLLTRVDDQDKAYYRHFFLEFSGLKTNEFPAPEIASSTGATISEPIVEWNDYNASWRVSFYVSTPENKVPHELTCRLIANGQPITETWSYTWTP